ncbi:MAG: hypothetical protein K6D56_01220 [Clostridia bacterium]|nr:hypothetical protein [Clostridia bacterium]
MREAFGILLDFRLFKHRLSHFYAKQQQKITLKISENREKHGVFGLRRVNGKLPEYCQTRENTGVCLKAAICGFPKIIVIIFESEKMHKIADRRITIYEVQRDCNSWHSI